ncbi:MAG: TIGR02099 family protein [Candidatus Polarisedimenticolaceae bacterium]|nr:TIGR02099 family protein [Candidatus Polarisedimenticolaceae bacterium]
MSILNCRTTTFCVRSLVLLLLLVALLIIVVRAYLLPSLQQYRGDLEQLVAAEIGQPIKIGKISAGMWGVHLEVVLKDVALIDPVSGRQQLYARELHAQINLKDSLMDQRLTLGKIMLVGTRLQLILQKDGTVVLEGFEGSSQSTSGAVGGLLFQESELLLQDSEVFWKNQRIEAPPLRFSDVNVALVNQGGRHWLKAEAQLGANLQSRIELRAELAGDLAEPGGWRGEVYFKAGQLALGELLAARRPQGTQIDQGTLDAEIWTRWEESRLTQLEGDFDVHHLKLTISHDQQVRQHHLERLKSGVSWQAGAGGWQLSLPALSLTKSGVVWSQSGFALDVGRDVEQRLDLHARVKFIQLGDILPIAMFFLPQDHEQLQLLSKLALQVDLRDFDLRLNELAEGRYDWRLAGRLNNLNTQPLDGIPGVNGLNLAFNATAEQGSVNLLSDDFTLNLAGLFRAPIKFDQLQGRVDWQLTDDALRLLTDQMRLSDGEFNTVSTMDLQIPFDQQPLFIDMQTRFDRGSLSAIRHYLPTAIMHEDLVNWLDRALVSGQISNGTMALHGPLNAFPFTANEGHFQVLFDVDDATFDYMPKWPPIKQAQAQVRFLNSSLDVQIKQAKLLQSDVKEARVQIEDMTQGTPVHLQSALSGPSTTLMKILGETTLSEQFAPLVETLNVAGEAEVNIDLSIPMSDDDRFRIKGDVAWLDAVVTLPTLDLKLTEVRGNLAFTEKGVSAKTIQATVLGEKTSVKISTNADQTIILRAKKLPLNSKRLAEKLPGIYLEHLQGTADIDLEMRIGKVRKGRRSLTVAVKSDLKGIAVNAPPPLAKAKNKRHYFRLNGDLTHPKKIRFDIDYGGGLDATLLVDGKRGRLLKAALQPGAKSPKLPKEAAIKIAGDIDQIDWGLWHKWLHGLKKSKQGGKRLPLLFDLNIGALHWLDQTWQQVALQGRDEAGLLKVQFSGPALDGHLRLYEDEADHHKNSVDLKQLHLGFDFDVAAVNDKKPPLVPTEDDPREFPPLKVNIEKMVVNNKLLGKLSVALQAQKNGIDMRGFRLEGRQLDVSADGSWTLQGGQHTTTLDLFLNCSNLGQMLEDLKFASNIHGTNLGGTMRLKWSLPVTQLRAEALSGHVDVLASDGRFRSVDPGIGRLIGLLSIAEIGRRMTLDFSDLFGDGFAFNDIVGSMQIEKGDAYTEDMVIEGPSARIEMVGRSGLATHDYDQIITVTPAISAGIPLVGLLAGGPLVGAVLLGVQKLIGGKVDETAQTKYKLTGSWDDPLIEPIEAPKPESESIKRDNILDFD